MGAAAAAVTYRANAAPSSPGRPADAFVDSVGVNVHLGSEPYASSFGRFRSLIGASFIRHLRDELRPANDLARWRGLHAAFGIRSHLLVSPATNTVPQMLEYLAALGVQRVSAIEGQNEGDSDWFMAQDAARLNWSAAVVAYQRDVFAALRSRYAAASLPILSPSIIDWKPADVWLIRRAASFCDIVAIHAYVQHGQEPETQDGSASLDWYLRHMRDAFKPGAPVMATETGYTNVVRPGGAGVSERAAGIYLPRLLLNNFDQGVARTFLYEFMDGGADPADGEHHYGLVRHDGTPKPAYDAIVALLTELHDPGGASEEQVGPPAALADAPPETRIVVLRKRDGSAIAALWRAVRSWDPARGVDIAVSPVPVQVSTGAVRQASWMVPGEGLGWADFAIRDGAVTAPVTDKVGLLRLR